MTRSGVPVETGFCQSDVQLIDGQEISLIRIGTGMLRDWPARESEWKRIGMRFLRLEKDDHQYEDQKDSEEERVSIAVVSSGLDPDVDWLRNAETSYVAPNLTQWTCTGVSRLAEGCPSGDIAESRLTLADAHVRARHVVVATLVCQIRTARLIVLHDSNTRPEIVVKEQAGITLTISHWRAGTSGDAAFSISDALRTSRFQGHHLAPHRQPISALQVDERLANLTGDACGS